MMMKSSIVALIVCFGILSGTTSAIRDDAESAEFGRKAVRQPRRVEEIVATELLFRELADEDGLLVYSMSMSMSMADPVVATTLAPISAGPTSTPTIANVTEEASDSPSIAPNATISESSPPESAVVESPVTSALSVSGSPTSTAVVAMASAGGVILALLAIRRSRTKGDYYEDLDTHQLKDGSTRSTIDEDAQCSGAEILAASVAGGARRSMSV